MVSPAFWASLLGIRVTPSQIYFFCPSWWYVGLLVQLYLVFIPEAEACNE